MERKKRGRREKSYQLESFKSSIMTLQNYTIIKKSKQILDTFIILIKTTCVYHVLDHILRSKFMIILNTEETQVNNHVRI